MDFTPSSHPQAMSACPPFIGFLYQLLSLNAELLSSDAALYSIDHAADESGATLVFQLAHLLSCKAVLSRVSTRNFATCISRAQYWPTPRKLHKIDPLS